MSEAVANAFENAKALQKEGLSVVVTGIAGVGFEPTTSRFCDGIHKPIPSVKVPRVRDLDLVLFGATGFVGKLTAGYLAAAAPDGARIGLAGRSQERLERVL